MFYFFFGLLKLKHNMVNISAVVGLLIAIPLCAGLLKLAIDLQRNKATKVMGTIQSQNPSAPYTTVVNATVDGRNVTRSLTLPNPMSVGQPIALDVKNDAIQGVSHIVAPSTIGWVAFVASLVAAMLAVWYAISN